MRVDGMWRHLQVDSHWTRDFETNEVYELHGNVETWQCAGDVETSAREPCKRTWTLPVDFRFDLDATTMRAPGAAATTCPECGGKGRPNVLMFRDRQWIANVSEEVQRIGRYRFVSLGCVCYYLTFANVLVAVQNRYIAWESVMELVRLR